MSLIRQTIEKRNRQNQKILSVFLTAGYPYAEGFVDLALQVLDAGADFIELGIPFSDPLADGAVIQHSSQIALENGITMDRVFLYAEQIKSKCKKPLILMGYANPLLQYGLHNFVRKVQRIAIDGCIVPDVPLEEYENFWSARPDEMDIILLATPTSPAERIQKIDQISSGFVYCVSVTGTTGVQDSFAQSEIDHLSRIYDQITENKMLVGFGISAAKDVAQIKPYCDGIIVGSAVIGRLQADSTDFSAALDLVREMRQACDD
jgi:tryptophan synthase alpha chain